MVFFRFNSNLQKFFHFGNRNGFQLRRMFPFFDASFDFSKGKRNQILSFPWRQRAFRGLFSKKSDPFLFFCNKTLRFIGHPFSFDDQNDSPLVDPIRKRFAVLTGFKRPKMNPSSESHQTLSPTRVKLGKNPVKTVFPSVGGARLDSGKPSGNPHGLDADWSALSHWFFFVFVWPLDIFRVHFAFFFFSLVPSMVYSLFFCK